jgi:DNA-binding LacI/PurR family transcriptional regulator
MPKPESGERQSFSPQRRVSLKQLAAHLELSPTTISLVLNRAAGARSIPQHTKDRVLAAARELGYQPSFVARSLRSKRSYMVGVLVPEVSGSNLGHVLDGIEDYLIKEGYVYLVVSHRSQPKLIDRYPTMLLERSVEGLIVVDTPYDRPLPMPAVAIWGHPRGDGAANIVLDHSRAAELSLRHLLELGHRKIAFFKGQAGNSDSEARLKGQRAAAGLLGVPMLRPLVVPLTSNLPSPEVGYAATRKLLKSGAAFTALVSCHDTHAIGAIRALREAGLRVPQDVSVVGFNDTEAAAFHDPALTTIRQPLREMGRLAAEVLLRRISSKSAEGRSSAALRVEPQLVARQSTAAARGGRSLPAAST